MKKENQDLWPISNERLDDKVLGRCLNWETSARENSSQPVLLMVAI